jgi:UDP:flavonoid glycosyltransferase YjiC (YdhE family)
MARFLLQTHAPTTGLAHLGTAIALGTELQRRGHETLLAYGGRLPELIDRAGLAHEPVAEVPPEREWAPSEWFRTVDELAPAVDSHLRLIDSYGPDAIVSCHGIHGRLAAELAGVPRVHVFHYLHGSRYAKAVSLNRDRVRDLTHPRRAWRVARARVRRLRRRGATNPVATAVEELRRRRGLPAAPPDAIGGCTDSIVAISTAPFIVPADGLPAHWRYVGPISWSPSAPEPRPPEGPGPLAYVSQGSTGSAELLLRAAEELAGNGFRVVATTASLVEPAALEARGAEIVAAPLLDGRACMEVADVAVIHGGQQTMMEAMRLGTPVVALPTRRDQIGHVHRIEGLGVGVGLYPEPRRRGAVSRAARKVLRPEVRARCAALAERLRDDWDGVNNTVDLAEGLARGHSDREAA